MKNLIVILCASFLAACSDSVTVEPTPTPEPQPEPITYPVCTTNTFTGCIPPAGMIMCDATTYVPCGNQMWITLIPEYVDKFCPQAFGCPGNTTPR